MMSMMLNHQFTYYFSASGGTSKFHFVRVIYKATSKKYVYQCLILENPKELRPTGTSTVDIGGTTIHFGLGIKPGIKLLSLNDKSKAALRNSLSEVKCLVIDELSMVLTDLWSDIDSMLEEIFLMNPEIAFIVLSIMTAGDFPQLLPVRAKLAFSQFSDKYTMKHLLAWQLWNLFKYAKLTKIVRQSYILFIDLINKVEVGNIEGHVEKITQGKIHI